MAIDSKDLVGGGGLPINAMLEVNSADDLYIATDSTEWLKTGVIETDVASYPDAKKNFSFTSASYAGVSFSVTSSTTGITWDGTHFWVVGYSTDSAYQYTSTGAYTGINFSVAAQDTSPAGIMWDGTHFWVVGSSSDKAYQYTSTGAYTGVNFSVAAQDTAPADITWDGTHFWVVGDYGNKAYKYEADGVEYAGILARSNGAAGLPNYTRIK